MLTLLIPRRSIYKTCSNLSHPILLSCPFSSTRITQNQKSNTILARTRNVGIIAHIDAGKTTTTERMLYYSGHTKRIGNVDEGSTVTDFLPAERARGITIQSAAITFHWTPEAWLPQYEPVPVYNINLIDTPGHADFTFEVLRSLRVLDGAVCILDGVAGVEAQTEKVFNQARAYSIPTVFYVNKLDRNGARFGEAVRQIASKLRIMPVVCQIPWYDDRGETLIGVIDVVNMRGLRWVANGDGKDLTIVPLPEIGCSKPKLMEEAYRARTSLVEILSEEDETMVENFLEYKEDHLAVPAEKIWSSIRRCLLVPKPRISPVFAGASFRNIGVQPVLDAVANLLPSPEDTPDPSFTTEELSGGLREFVSGKLALPKSLPKQTGKLATRKRASYSDKIADLEACALAFKVVNDSRRGILVYVRVYYGSLNRNAILYNTNLQTVEKMPRLLRMYAADAVDEVSIKAGDIAVIPGLKHARTGDTLITFTGINPKTGPPIPFKSLQLRPIDIPPPVFFAAIEPHAAAYQSAINASLDLLLREDPSLQLGENEDTGQQLLSGMGELHLEIASNRLIQDFKAKATIGKIEIAYRECPSYTTSVQDIVYESTLASIHSKAGCSASISALVPEEMQDPRLTDGNLIVVNGTSDEGSETNFEVLSALRNGALAALARGPTLGYPVSGAKVSLTFDSAVHQFGSLTSISAISGAARKATRAVLEASAKISSPCLLEPVMRVVVKVEESTLGSVARDLETSRHGVIESLGEFENTSDVSLSGMNDISVIDLQRVYSPPDPFESQTADPFSSKPQAIHGSRAIIAKVPLKEMVGYLKHLRSLTAGRGSFTMEIDGFARMNKQRENLVLKELRGDL